MVVARPFLISLGLTSTPFLYVFLAFAYVVGAKVTTLSLSFFLALMKQRRATANMMKRNSRANTVAADPGFCTGANGLVFLPCI